MGKTKMEYKKLDFLTGTQKCVFCHTEDVDEMKYGPIYMHKNIITHYYCLLLSSNMEQNGKDSDGILGFLLGDINKEVKRGMRLYCSYCRSGGATLGCAIGKCKVVFHLPCGMKHGTLHQFFGEFKSYCAKHRPVQRISEKILAESSKGATCGICYEKVVPRPIHETLWAPCCQKNAFFHRDCVQRLAISAGYFFKCPLCNNTTTFLQAMKEFGIYIPEQDASWECVPQAYQDLLVRHETCDSANCSCPNGRKTNIQGTRWELILCKFCGSQGIHIGCGRLKWKCPEFECDICSRSASETQEGYARNSNGNRHRLSGMGTMGKTADIHPSVSADREKDASESSDDSAHVTISNRMKKVLSPPPRTKTPPDKITNVGKTNKKAISCTSTDREPACNTVTFKDSKENKLLSRAIVIDDSDDDVELVGETEASSGCLKTNDGSMIPVVQINSKNVQKRLRVVNDVRVNKPEESVDITHIVAIQMQGPSKKPKVATPPPVKEVVYSFPPLQPSASAIYNAPSTSFVPTDGNRFVLIDPTTFRPEELPPGTLLYRSVQPAQVQHQPQMQPQHQPQIQPQPPTSLPMQQLGSSHANAKHPNLCKHRSRGSHNLNSHHLQKHSKKASREIKHNSAGRRRGRRRSPSAGCDNNRLNPRVVLSPLTCRISNDGHFVIVLPRMNLESSSKKRKASPSFIPKKRIKLSTKSNNQNHVKSTKIQNRKGKTASSNSISGDRSNEFKKGSYNKSEDNQLVTSSPKAILNSEQKSVITNFFSSQNQQIERKHEIKSNQNKKGKKTDKTRKKIKINKNVSPENNLNTNIRENKFKNILEKWVYKTIQDYYLTIDNQTSTLQSEVNSQENHSLNVLDQENEKRVLVKTVLDEIIDLAMKPVKEGYFSKEPTVTNHFDENKPNPFETNTKCNKSHGDSPNGFLCSIDSDSLINNPKNVKQNNVKTPVGNKIPGTSKNFPANNEDTVHLMSGNVIDKIAECQKMTSSKEDHSTGSDLTQYAETIFNLEKGEKIKPLRNSAQVSQTEEGDNSSGMVQEDISCITLPVYCEDNTNKIINNCKQIRGCFPKIKLCPRTKFKLKKNTSNHVNNISKTQQDEIKLKDKQGNKHKETSDSNKSISSKAQEQDTFRILNKGLPINYYFTPIKKEISGSNKDLDSQNTLGNNTSNNLFEEEKRAEAVNLLSEIDIKNHSIRQYEKNKTPLAELQFNVISNFG